MANVDKRVLSFFVSSALLAGSAACSKNKTKDEPRTNTAHQEEHVNEGPEPVEAEPAPDAMLDKVIEEDHVNEGPATPPAPAADKTKPVTGKIKPVRPVNVNTTKVPDPKND